MHFNPEMSYFSYQVQQNKKIFSDSQAELSNSSDTWARGRRGNVSNQSDRMGEECG